MNRAATPRTYGWAILTLGMAYGATICFTFYGPVMARAAGSYAPALSLVAVAFHVLAFYLPDFSGKAHDRYLIILAALLVPGVLAFGLMPVWAKAFVTILFAWTVGRIGCFWTRHVSHTIPEGFRGRVIALALSLSFFQLYLANMIMPGLTATQALAVPAAMMALTLFAYGKMKKNSPILPEPGSGPRVKEPHYFSFLLTMYISGGATYAGIYPYFAPFAQVDRYVNVCALFLAAPLAGWAIDRGGIRMVVALGGGLLGISHGVFLFIPGLAGYLGTQCLLQAGWGFINVFGWYFSWSMASQSGQSYHFARGISAMLLGAAIGAFGAHLAQAWGLTGRLGFSLLALIPLCLALVWFLFLSRSLEWEAAKKGTPWQI